ncbi:FtsX-like permease family protein [Streptomyces sp. NPDC048629]|uniref:FtsX-like permease family protein n=1 Tax=Streptomyces sp. NPDC048629 TaxID=3154824 RepID=UPI00343055F9
MTSSACTTGRRPSSAPCPHWPSPARLRRSGATPRQLLGTVAAETGFVVALGAVLGALAALPSLLGIRAGLSGTLGVPVDMVVPWTPVLTAVAGCLLLALAASVLPARRALRD